MAEGQTERRNQQRHKNSRLYYFLEITEHTLCQIQIGNLLTRDFIYWMLYVGLTPAW